LGLAAEPHAVAADIPVAVSCDDDLVWLRLRAHASVLARVAQWAGSGTAYDGAALLQGSPPTGVAGGCEQQQQQQQQQQQKGARAMLPLPAAAPPFTSPLSCCQPFEPPSALGAEWALARRHPAVANALRAMRAEHAEWLRAQSRTLLRYSTAAAQLDDADAEAVASGSDADDDGASPGACGPEALFRAGTAADARVAEDGDDECPVCMHRLLPASEELSACGDADDDVVRPQDAQLVVTTTCGHRFHLACLRKSRKYSTGCPLCRAAIATGLSPAQKTKRPARASADGALQASSLIGVNLSLDVPRSATGQFARASASGALLRSMRRSSGWGPPPPRNAGRPIDLW